MKAILKRSITFKDGETWTTGAKVNICIDYNNPMIANIMNFATGTTRTAQSINLHKWFNEFEPFTMEDLEEATFAGVCPSLTGQDVEPDGWDSEGMPSILLASGVI